MKYIRFILKPRKSYKEYYSVRIYNKKADMHQRLIDTGDIDNFYWSKNKPTCEAICRSFERVRISKDLEQKLPECGEILFYRGFLGAGIVAHEITHASLGFFRNVMKLDISTINNTKKGRQAGDSEEILCELNQAMNAMFWDKFYKYSK